MLKVDFDVVARQHSLHLGWRYAAGDFQNPRDGILYFDSVVSLNPHNADAYAALGQCYYLLKEPRYAIAAYEKAVRLRPDFYPFRQNLAYICASVGEREKAALLLGESLR